MAKKEKGYGIDTLAQLWKAGLDLDGAVADRPQHPYSQNSWVYACVNEIIKTARGVQLMLSTEADKIVESGPAYDLLFSNPKMPFTRFLSTTVGLLSLYRECYWLYLDMDISKPKNIMVVGPDQLKPVIRRGVVEGYELRLAGGRIPLFISDVYPIIDFNPYSDIRGIGPATVGELAISSSYQASLLNEATLANGGKIGNLITVPGGISEEEKRFLISQFESRHKGARNAGKTCLMTGGAEVKNLAQSMADMQMLDLRRFDAAEICILFGVPPEIVGLNSEAQYAHGPAQQRFIVNTIAPLLAFIAEHITAGLLAPFAHREHGQVSVSDSSTYPCRRSSLKSVPAYRTPRIKAAQAGHKLFAWFAIDEHPTIQAMTRERAKEALEYTDKGVPLNQCIDAFDLPFEHVPWGDDWWVQMGLVPARYTLDGGLESVTGPSLPEGGEGEDDEAGSKSIKAAAPESTKADEQQRLRLWRSWVASWAGIEREYMQSVRTYFRRQERILTAELKKAWPSEKAVTKDADDIITRVVFDLRKENDKLKVIHKTFFTKASELGIRQGLSELGVTAEALDALTERIKNTNALRSKLVISTTKIAKVNETTKKLIADHLKTGMDAGENLNQLTDRIKNVLGGNRPRALSIARTSTAGAVGTGRHNGLKAAGGELKRWVTSGDDNVRSTHVSAAAESAAGIPMDQPFIVGGAFLMYPADPGGPAGEIVNCRCIEVIIKAQGKAIDPFVSGVKFYSYEDMQKAHLRNKKNE